MQLENKVAAVTGSSLGIGRAIALAFGREGASVAINYRSHPEEGREAVQEIEKSGGKAISVQADVSEPEGVKRLIQQTVKEFGRLDVMVNNAGIEQKIPFLETPLEVWEKVIPVMGEMALTRNLRNFDQAGIGDDAVVKGVGRAEEAKILGLFD